MSEVTDILCAVSSGDLAGASSSLDASALSVACLSTAGTSGTGESVLLSCAAEDDESGLLRSERDDFEGSACESGRGVISEASSKLSCGGAHAISLRSECSVCYSARGDAVHSHRPCRSFPSSSASRSSLLRSQSRPWCWCGVPEVRVHGGAGMRQMQSFQVRSG
jgi:hypothetical protein